VNTFKKVSLVFSTLITVSCFAQPTKIENTEQFKNIITQNNAVVAKFHAPWCPACVAIGPLFKEVANIDALSHITFVEVNYDDNYELIKAYKIRSIPTFVILKNGQEAERIVDSANKEQFVERLIELFPLTK